jgi:multidrug resistance efflux pump
MTPVDNELKEEIKKGVTLHKVDDAEMKKREEEKKKRMEELEKIKEALGEK